MQTLSAYAANAARIRVVVIKSVFPYGRIDVTDPETGEDYHLMYGTRVRANLMRFASWHRFIDDSQFIGIELTPEPVIPANTMIYAWVPRLPAR